MRPTRLYLAITRPKAWLPLESQSALSGFLQPLILTLLQDGWTVETLPRHHGSAMRSSVREVLSVSMGT